MLERLAALIALNVFACGACSAAAERSTGAEDTGLGADSNEAAFVHCAIAKTPPTAEALCPAARVELPQPVGSPLWLQSYGAGQITSIASDSAGSVLFARGSEVSKLNDAGTLLWSKPFGAQVAVDDQDSVYVAGTFAGTLALGDSTLHTDGRAGFLVKLGAEGNVTYARVLDQVADGDIESLTVDRDGNAALSGPGFGTLKLDVSGNPLWQKAFSGKLKFDSAGHLLLAGELVGTLDFGAGILTSQGGADVLMLKLDSGGTPIWAHGFGDAGALQQAGAIAVDEADDVIVVGTFDGRLDFGAGALQLTPTQCSSDAWCLTNGFAAKLDAEGRAVWSVALGPMRAVSSVAVDANGSAVLSGALPGGVRPFRQTWLAKLDANGAEVWRRSEWPDTGIGAGQGVAIDREQRVFWSLSARPSLELEEQPYLVKLTP